MGKQFVDYDNAESLFTAVGEKYTPIPITKDEYDDLSEEEKSSHRYIITDYPELDFSAKADKVTGATNGNFAGLDANGNLADSGKKASDFEPTLDLTETTLTGNPIVVNGKKLVIGTKVTFEPIQAGSGDPSPSNVRAISGYDSVELNGCGKNLIQGFEQGSLDNSATKDTESTRVRMVNFVKYKANTPVTLSISSSVSGKTIQRLGLIYATNSFGNNTKVTQNSWSDDNTFQFSEDGYLILIIRYSDNSNISPSEITAQLEFNSQATSYEPYNPITSISNPLPETVYGGTLDVESGELVVNKGIVDLGDANWTKLDNKFVVDAQLISTLNYIETNIYCNIYLSSDVQFTDMSDYSIVVQRSLVVTGHMGIGVNDSRYISADASEFKTAMQGVKLVYPIATPYTIKLTPAQVRLLATQSVITTNGTTIELTVSNAKVASIEAVDSVKESVNELAERIITEYEYILSDGLNLNPRSNTSIFLDDLPSYLKPISIHVHSGTPNQLSGLFTIGRYKTRWFVNIFNISDSTSLVWPENYPIYINVVHV